MDKDWSVDETINQIKHLLLEKDAEILRLRVKFGEIIKLNPFHNATPPIDKQYYAQIIIEMINVANAALKDGE